MLEIFEASVTGTTGFRSTGEKLVSSIPIEGALSEVLAKELGNGELYRKNGALTEFTSHGFDHDIEAARVSFYPLPGTPAEKDALLHIPSCSVKSFAATKLDGSGATVSFKITTDILAKAIIAFLDDVRGWSGRLMIEELQQELPLEQGLACTCGHLHLFKEGTTEVNTEECVDPECACGEFKEQKARKKGLPAPPKKRGRGAQPKAEEATGAEVVHVLHTGEADVKVTKSGKARLVPRKPKGGEKKAPGRKR
jgi:hypothetical protein